MYEEDEKILFLKDTLLKYWKDIRIIFAKLRLMFK